MIVCPNCKVEIGCRTEVCPLCHTNLIDAGIKQSDIKRKEFAFPKRGKLPFLLGKHFDLVYFAVFSLIVVASILIELFTMDKKVNVSWIVIASMLYVYLFLRLVIQSSSYFTKKVLGQAFLLTGLACSTLGVISRPLILVEYVLPTIYLIAIVLIVVYVIIHRNAPRKHLLNLLSISLLAVIPMIAVYATGSTSTIYALVVAIIGGVIVLVSAIVFWKTIINELKRAFHI